MPSNAWDAAIHANVDMTLTLEKVREAMDLLAKAGVEWDASSTSVPPMKPVVQEFTNCYTGVPPATVYVGGGGGGGAAGHGGNFGMGSPGAGGGGTGGAGIVNWTSDLDSWRPTVAPPKDERAKRISLEELKRVFEREWEQIHAAPAPVIGQEPMAEEEPPLRRIRIE